MRIGLISAVLFVGTVVAANWALQRFGVVSVGFGLAAPAGVYFVGLAFTLRDIVHRTLGRLAVIACILVGAAVSYYISDAITLPGGHVSIALASGIAFLLSETADLAVYEPLSHKTFLGGVVASNIVGAFVDSALFLWLAFGSTAFIWGQVVGKFWMTLAAIPVVLTIRPLLPERGS